jgi:hypothetical protein
MGCIFAPMFSAATLGVAPNEAGIASAMVNTSQQIGGSVGTSALNDLRHRRGQLLDQPPPRPRPRFCRPGPRRHYGFWWAAGIFSVGFLLALLIPPSQYEARTATTITPLARHAIGNRNHDETADGAGSPEPALMP